MRAPFFFCFFLFTLALVVAGCAAPGDGPHAVGTSRQAATTIMIGGGEQQSLSTTTTVGETLLVPAADSFLHQVTFHLDAKGASFDLSVYAWDDVAKKVTGNALATSTRTGTGLNSYPLAVDAPLTAGTKVIAIVACAACAGTSAYIDAQTAGYADGALYTPTGGNFTNAWASNGSLDLALSAVFFTPTTMTVTSDAPKAFGQTVTLSASVPEATGGTVTFVDDQGTALPTKTLGNDHTASITTSALSLGAHTITASYDGGSGFQPNSATTTAMVTKSTTTIAVPTSTANPSKIGQPVTFSTTVTGQGVGNATGTVTFSADGNPLGNGTLAGGAASITTSTLSLDGAHKITAVYNGDTNFAASAPSAALTQAVNTDTVAIGVVSSANPSTYSADVTLSITVTSSNTYSGVPDGFVTVTDGATGLAPTKVDGAGKVAVTLTAPIGGAHNLAIHYDSDSKHADADATYVQTVNPVTPTVTLTDPTSKVYGETISFVATVAPPSAALAVPTGTVSFYDAATLLGTATVTASGQASFAPTSAPLVAAHNISAVYAPAAGEKNYLTSTSTTKVQVVGQATTTTTLTTASQPSVAGTSVSFTATISVTLPGRATSPRGSVTFYDDGVALSGAVTVTGSTAAYAATLNAVGDHPITAVYSGTTNLTTSTGSLTQKVTQLGATVKATSSSANATSSYGDAVVFTVKVTSATGPVPSGMVTITDDTLKTTIGTATLTAGTTTISTSTLAGGTHTILATYNGDTSYIGGAIGTVVQTVNAAASTVGLTSSLNPSVYGQSVTFTATAGSSVTGARTGSIAFKDGLTTLQMVTLNNGTATLTTSALVAVSHSITAVYTGDTNYLTSASAALAQLVSKGNTTTSVVSSSTPSLIGTSVTFTATVSAVAPSTGTPTGTVTFRDNGNAIGTGSLDKDGFAPFSTATLAAGNHDITAVYSGSTNHNGSTSGIYVQRVNTEAAMISLTATPKSAPPHGEPITFTATLSGKLETPTGAMLFKEGPATLGAGALASGVSSFATTVLAAGTHTIVAAYSGDQTYAVGSGAVALAVSKQATTTTVRSSANPAAIGAAVTLSAHVESPSPGFTGQVQFLDAETSLGFAVLTGTTASLVVNGLTAGDHAITAVYSGDGNFTGSTANVLMQNLGVIDTDAGADGGVGASGASGDSGGCGCRATGGAPNGTLAPFGIAGLALAGLGIARRRRQR